jgi:hypothetical protein
MTETGMEHTEDEFGWLYVFPQTTPHESVYGSDLVYGGKDTFQLSAVRKSYSYGCLGQPMRPIKHG